MFCACSIPHLRRCCGDATRKPALRRAVANVMAGRGAVVVLRGPAGIGKSALLEQAADSAGGCRILRAVGVESEMELPFASLHQLCAPLLSDIDALPATQREAFGSALGHRTGSAPDGFVVGLALLNLLSTAANREPLLCVVDDAHWLDRSSALALGFVARRIRDEPVGLLLAEREGQELQALAGLPALRLEGLADADARALLACAGAHPLDERIRDRDARQPARAARAASRRGCRRHGLLARQSRAAPAESHRSELPPAGHRAAARHAAPAARRRG
ncbi:MAG TPA: ATP-binding protein [Solirubrobacter sp.]|nr:ATP-binding protein [Solirubrobacter sp.]